MAAAQDVATFDRLYSVAETCAHFGIIERAVYKACAKATAEEPIATITTVQQAPPRPTIRRRPVRHVRSSSTHHVGRRAQRKPGLVSHGPAPAACRPAASSAAQERSARTVAKPLPRLRVEHERIANTRKDLLEQARLRSGVAVRPHRRRSTAHSEHGQKPPPGQKHPGCVLGILRPTIARQSGRSWACGRRSQPSVHIQDLLRLRIHLRAPFAQGSLDFVSRAACRSIATTTQRSTFSSGPDRSVGAQAWHWPCCPKKPRHVSGCGVSPAR